MTNKRTITATRMFFAELGHHWPIDRLRAEIMRRLFLAANDADDVLNNCEAYIICRGDTIPSHLDGGIKDGKATADWIGLTFYRPINKKRAAELCEVAEQAYRWALEP